MAIRPTILTLACLAVLASGLVNAGDEPVRSGGDLRGTLIATLVVASDAEIAAAKMAVTEQLRLVDEELSQQAIGAVLRAELQFEQLASALQPLRPNPVILRAVERNLRRRLTGQVQAPVNELRRRVHHLATLVSLNPDRILDATESIELLTAQLNESKPITRRVNETECRHAFAVLSDLHPSADALESIRSRLSMANHRVQVKRDYVTAIARRSFDLPVNFRQNINSTDIRGNGSMHIETSLELPQSLGQSQLRIMVSGTGTVGLTATRDIVHMKATTASRISGTQWIALAPKGVSGESPLLQARFRTRLTGICLEGLLGKCDLARRIGGQIVQNELAKNDISAARQFEKTARDRIEEEGFDVAYKINQLLEQNFWDRLQAIDVEPELQIRNDETGIVSEASYARYDQLGAVTPVPGIPAEIDQHLDLVTWVHESMINNASDRLSGLRLDEATIRGLWEVEFKLTSEAWQALPRGRIPAAITLAADNPLQIQFADQGVEILLRTVSCELDGNVRDTEPREFRMRYQLVKDDTGAHFIQQEAGATAPLPDDIAIVWKEVLGRFFGKSIRPMPKFRNQAFPQFLQLGYLELDGGWLVIGAARVPEASSAITTVSAEERP